MQPIAEFYITGLQEFSLAINGLAIVCFTRSAYYQREKWCHYDKVGTSEVSFGIHVRVTG